jgi:phosphatidylserine/phosphatidylglycerophosphate/cardiolipin synthase-like enzyme
MKTKCPIVGVIMLTFLFHLFFAPLTSRAIDPTSVSTVQAQVNKATENLEIPVKAPEKNKREGNKTQNPITEVKVGETKIALAFSPSKSYTVAFLDLVDQAKEEIKMAMYNMDCPDLFKTLKNASKRGVKIEIAIHSDPRKEDVVYNQYIEKLKTIGTVHTILTATLQDITASRKAAGAEPTIEPNNKINPVNTENPVNTASPKLPVPRFISYVAQHHKFMIVDRQVVWTGSGNASERAFNYNDEAAIIINNANVAEVFDKEFQRLLNTPPKDIWKKQLVTSIALDDKTNIEILMLPAEQSAVSYLCDLLDSAKEEVLILMSEITNDRIGNKLIELKKRGVRVSIITNKYKTINKHSDIRKLERAGINVVYSNNDHTLHQRCMSIDNSKVLVSSANFSARGLEANIENMVVLENSQLAQALKDEFKRCSEAIPYQHSKWGESQMRKE